MSKISIIVSLCLVAVLAFACVYVAVFELDMFKGVQQGSVSRTGSLDSYATTVVQACADAPHRPTCYEEEVPKLVSELSTEDIFEVIRKIRIQDREYLFCHVLAHELGAYEVSLNPDNWLDVIATGPTDGLCSNGYAHGALVTRFHDEELSEAEFNYALEDLAIACEPREGFNPTDLTKAICYHGLGHVLIHMTLADVKKSLSACEYVGRKNNGSDYRQVCTEGVYMQLFQPLEPEDFALIDMLAYAPTRDNLAQFCGENSSNDKQYGACWREGWPFFGDEIYDSAGVVAYCSQLTESQDVAMCYQTAFTINGRQHLGDADTMAQICNGLPATYQGDCFARSANAFLEEDTSLIDEGIAMCAQAKEPEAQDECYSFLAQVAPFNFHKDSEPFERLCDSLPPAYANRCRGT